MLHRLIGCVEGVLSYFFLPVKHSTSVVLRALNVHGYCPPEDKHRYEQFKETTAKSIVVFNHPTFFDHIVIMKELEDTPRFVMLKKYMVGPFKWIAHHLKAVAIRKSSGASQVISNEVNRRKKGEELLAISPAGGKVSDERSWFLYPFKTGAFLSRPKVLPIVIHYSPYKPWSSNISLYETLHNQIGGPPIKYVMRVLEPMEPYPSEKTSEFAERCRRTMMKQLLLIDHGLSPIEQSQSQELGSIDCVTTSHLFLVCGIAAILNHLFLYGIGMITVFLTSWMYHGTGDPLWRKIDITSNLILIAFFGFMLLRARQYKPLIMLAIASACYVANLPHALFVHVPIAIGFALIER